MRVVILIVCLLTGVMQAGYSQGPKVDAPVVRLGNLDTAKVTCDELLKNNRLMAADSRWAVTRFSVSFTVPSGKVYGPYAVTGDKFSDEVTRVIKRLKATKAEINIAEIMVAKGSMEKYTLPVILRYNN